MAGVLSHLWRQNNLDGWLRRFWDSFINPLGSGMLRRNMSAGCFSVLFLTTQGYATSCCSGMFHAGWRRTCQTVHSARLQDRQECNPRRTSLCLILLQFFFSPTLHQKKIYFGSSIHLVFNLFCQFQYSFFLITTDGVCITQHKVWHVEALQQSPVPFSAEAWYLSFITAFSKATVVHTWTSS